MVSGPPWCTTANCCAPPVFVLAVRSQLPAEQARQRILAARPSWAQSTRSAQWWNLQLPGVTLRNLPVAPRQLPFHAGSHHFELERQGDHWKQLERSGSLVLHVAGEIPGPKWISGPSDGHEPDDPPGLTLSSCTSRSIAYMASYNPPPPPSQPRDPFAQLDDHRTLHQAPARWWRRRASTTAPRKARPRWSCGRRRRRPRMA